MNTRIKEVRTDLHLTQEAFGDRIGIKRNSVAQIEIGVRNPSDQTITSICREFNVNRLWLETGDGPKYRKAPAGGIAREVQDILGHDNPFAVAVISSLLQMPKAWWEAWEAEYDKVTGRTDENKEGNG